MVCQAGFGRGQRRGHLRQGDAVQRVGVQPALERGNPCRGRQIRAAERLPDQLGHDDEPARAVALPGVAGGQPRPVGDSRVGQGDSREGRGGVRAMEVDCLAGCQRIVRCEDCGWVEKRGDRLCCSYWKDRRVVQVMPDWFCFVPVRFGNGTVVMGE